MLPDDPWFVASFHAITALGAIVVPVNPAFKQAELEFNFRSTGVRAVISDERAAGVCEQIAAGLDGDVEVITTSTAHGQAHTLDALLEEGSAEHLPARAPEETFVYPVLLRLDRTAQARAAHARPVRRRGGHVQVPRADPRGPDLLRDPLVSHLGHGRLPVQLRRLGCDARDPRSDPQPFLLKRRQAMELIERERATIFPGVPFNFRLMAEAPAGADLSSLRLCFSAGTALPARRASRPSASASACSCASSTAAPRRA